MIDLNITRLDKDTKYYFLPYGIGDALMVTLLTTKEFNDVAFIIQKQHEPLMKLLSIEKFLCIDEPVDSFIYRINSYNLRSQIPAPGKIYVAHPMKNPNERGNLFEIWSGKITFLQWYKKYLKITHNINPYECCINIPNISYETILKIRSLTSCDLSKIILFYPFSNTGTNHPQSFWVDLYHKYKTTDNFIISNRFVSEEIPFIDFELRESLSLMNSVNHIFSNRSGICDVFQYIGDKLTIIFPSAGQTHSVYSINTMVGYQKVNEYILNNNNMEKIT